MNAWPRCQAADLPPMPTSPTIAPSLAPLPIHLRPQLVQILADLILNTQAEVRS